jgi:hypothetical protein
METRENTLSAEDSLNLINSMISNAKNKLADDGFHLIFWGWLITACALFNYVAVILSIEWGSLVWSVLLPLGGIISAIYGMKQNKKAKVKTYVDKYLSFTWGGFIISLLVTLAFGNTHGIKSTYFFLMILYGIATFISGGILNFKPLIIGSLFAFACAIVSVFLGEDEQFLCIAASLLFSYVIPGHLLQSKYKSQSQNV